MFCLITAVDVRLLPPNLQSLYIHHGDRDMSSDFAHHFIIHLADPQWQQQLQSITAKLPKSSAADIPDIKRLCRGRGIVDSGITEAEELVAPIWSGQREDSDLEEEEASEGEGSEPEDETDDEESQSQPNEG